jgi:hypothetical protein
MMRAATSVDPPGGNGTISVIGREGKLSARVGASGAIEVSAINANATVATNLCMIPALTQRNRSGSILQMRIIHQTLFESISVGGGQRRIIQLNERAIGRRR